MEPWTNHPRVGQQASSRVVAGGSGVGDLPAWLKVIEPPAFQTVWGETARPLVYRLSMNSKSR